MAELPFATIDGKVYRLIYFSKCGKYWGNMPFEETSKKRKQKGKKPYFDKYLKR